MTRTWSHAHHDRVALVRGDEALHHPQAVVDARHVDEVVAPGLQVVLADPIGP